MQWPTAWHADLASTFLNLLHRYRLMLYRPCPSIREYPSLQYGGKIRNGRDEVKLIQILAVHAPASALDETPVKRVPPADQA